MNEIMATAPPDSSTETALEMSTPAKLQNDSEEHPHRQTEIPDISVLQDRMPEWFRSPKVFAGFGVLICVLFAFLSFRPLWHMDLWGHLSYGRLLWETGLQALWGTEPLMPLSEGIPFVDTAWLSQLIGFGTYELCGPAGLQFLFAFSISICLGLMAWRFYRRTGSALVTTLGLGAFFLLAWHQMFVNSPNMYVPSAMLRPQLAGWVCFIGLFTCLTSRRWHKAYWVLIPLLFTLWANLHGSFMVGLLMLGCFLVGRGIDIERRTNRLGAILKDPCTVRYLLLLQLSAIAVLLNPYGLQLYSVVWEFSSNPNLQALIEWDALTLRTNQGIAVALAAVVLMFLYRWTPRRIRSVEVFLLCGFGGLTLYYSRFLIWWAPVAAYYLVLHGNAVLKQDRKSQPVTEPAPRSSVSTVTVLGVFWICFAITPMGSFVVHQKETELLEAAGGITPIRAVEFLKNQEQEHKLPRGLIFSSYQWGDYLLWANPRPKSVFVATHLQFIPTTIWRQYFEIVNLDLDYKQVLESHGINIVLLSKSLNAQTIAHLKRDRDWRMGYEDERAVVLFRKDPI